MLAARNRALRLRGGRATLRNGTGEAGLTYKHLTQGVG